MADFPASFSFPGGKRDPSDKTILETALREMQEEISVSPEEVEVLGEYSAMPSKGCTMKVYPFVGFIKEPIEDISLVKYNDSEVHKVFTVPIKDLMNPEKRSMVRFRNSKFLYPVWKVEEENITIWGLTAFILDGKHTRRKKNTTRELDPDFLFNHFFRRSEVPRQRGTHELPRDPRRRQGRSISPCKTIRICVVFLSVNMDH